MRGVYLQDAFPSGTCKSVTASLPCFVTTDTCFECANAHFPKSLVFSRVRHLGDARDCHRQPSVGAESRRSMPLCTLRTQICPGSRERHLGDAHVSHRSRRVSALGFRWHWGKIRSKRLKSAVHSSSAHSLATVCDSHKLEVLSSRVRPLCIPLAPYLAFGDPGRGSASGLRPIQNFRRDRHACTCSITPRSLPSGGAESAVIRAGLDKRGRRSHRSQKAHP